MVNFDRNAKPNFFFINTELLRLSTLITSKTKFLEESKVVRFLSLFYVPELFSAVMKSKFERNLHR